MDDFIGGIFNFVVGVCVFVAFGFFIWTKVIIPLFPLFLGAIMIGLVIFFIFWVIREHNRDIRRSKVTELAKRDELFTDIIDINSEGLLEKRIKNWKRWLDAETANSDLNIAKAEVDRRTTILSAGRKLKADLDGMDIDDAMKTALLKEQHLKNKEKEMELRERDILLQEAEERLIHDRKITKAMDEKLARKK